jgi:hypothetical protein
LPRQLIEIANPLPGGQWLTSTKRAEDYCRRGVAYMLKDGRLQFRASFQKGRLHSDIYIDTRAKRDGAIWWNADDPRGMHKPGELVS